MDKINFENLPSENTPINADNLNLLQTNVENEFATKYNLNLGQNLATGTNLNNVMTPGTYYSENTTKTSSLVNAPITNAGFRLIVEYISGTNRIKQTIYVNANSPTTYSRMYTNSWQSWIKTVSVDDGTLTYNSDYFSTIDVRNYARFGNVIMCDFRGLISANIPNNSTLLTLPEAPVVSGTLVAFSGNEFSVSTPIWCSYNSSNKYLKVGSGLTSGQGKWLHIHLVYICA